MVVPNHSCCINANLCCHNFCRSFLFLSIVSSLSSLNSKKLAIIKFLFLLYGLCSAGIFLLVVLRASQSNKKCSKFSFVCSHRLHFVSSPLCLFSVFSFNVPVLASNNVVVAAVLSYNCCSS